MVLLEGSLAPLRVGRCGGRHGARGCDLDVHGGEFVVVLGPSGSGKTTLLNLIGALDRPTTGTIRAAGDMTSPVRRPACSPATGAGP